MLQTTIPTVASISADTDIPTGNFEVVGSTTVELNVPASLTFSETSVELSTVDQIDLLISI